MCPPMRSITGFRKRAHAPYDDLFFDVGVSMVRSLPVSSGIRRLVGRFVLRRAGLTCASSGCSAEPSAMWPDVESVASNPIFTFTSQRPSQRRFLNRAVLLNGDGFVVRVRRFGGRRPNRGSVLNSECPQARFGRRSCTRQGRSYQHQVRTLLLVRRCLGQITLRVCVSKPIVAAQSLPSRARQGCAPARRPVACAKSTQVCGAESLHLP